jgi:hypothetical protein
VAVTLAVFPVEPAHTPEAAGVIVWAGVALTVKVPAVAVAVGLHWPVTTHW